MTENRFKRDSLCSLGLLLYLIYTPFTLASQQELYVLGSHTEMSNLICFNSLNKEMETVEKWVKSYNSLFLCDQKLVVFMGGFILIILEYFDLKPINHI